MEKTLIAMSGGVDSSVAALLLKKAGFECAGATMRLFESDIQALAAKAAASMGMPHYIFDFRKEFQREVIDKFIHSYENGLTPNPCVDCNRKMKFGLFLEKMDDLGFEQLATGHYVRTQYDEKTGRILLKKGMDPTKDQSYVLYTLTQKQLTKLCFPLGELTKEKVRNLAQEYALASAHQTESQDICFIPDGDYSGFVRNSLDSSCHEGNFIDSEGNVLGRHKGIINYTIGQRKGLGQSFGQPLYVLGINAETNEVILGENEKLFRSQVVAEDINLISLEKISAPKKVDAKIRYNQEAKPGTVIQTGENRLEFHFDEPQRAVTPGQALVLYDGDVVVGGGTIV